MLRAYRQAQESLRLLPPDETLEFNLAEAQLRHACELGQVELEAMRHCVCRWMERDPLPILKRYMRRGAEQCLARAKESGLLLAALSDYHTEEKL
ncbi:MAG: hypothetical protein ACRD18_05005, partial [Terriglobia bacterium]